MHTLIIDYYKEWYNMMSNGYIGNSYSALNFKTGTDKKGGVANISLR